MSVKKAGILVMYSSTIRLGDASPGHVVIDMSSTMLSTEEESSSFGGRIYTILSSGISFDQYVSVTPLLIGGVVSVVAGTAVAEILKLSVIGMCLKGTGITFMVIAAYTEDTSLLKDKEAEQGSSWGRMINRILIVSGVVATICSMVQAIFISSTWLFLCNALSSIALIRVQSFMFEMDPIFAFSEQNAKLEEEVNSLQEVTQTQKAQVIKLETENTTYARHNEVLAKSIEVVKETLETDGGNLKGLVEHALDLVQKHSELQTLIKHGQEELAQINKELQTTSGDLRKSTTDLQRQVDRLANVEASTSPPGSKAKTKALKSIEKTLKEIADK